jgi:hypothetical protein
MQIYTRSTIFGTDSQREFILFNNAFNCYRYMASNDKKAGE